MNTSKYLQSHQWLIFQNKGVTLMGHAKKQNLGYSAEEVKQIAHAANLPAEIYSRKGIEFISPQSTLESLRLYREWSRYFPMGESTDYTGTLISGLVATVNRTAGIADLSKDSKGKPVPQWNQDLVRRTTLSPDTTIRTEPRCSWESPETSKYACDGGEPCGRPALAGSDFCEKHQEEEESETRGAILREGLRRVGCLVL
jgi:hypothetical protein